MERRPSVEGEVRVVKRARVAVNCSDGAAEAADASAAVDAVAADAHASSGAVGVAAASVSASMLVAAVGVSDTAASALVASIGAAGESACDVGTGASAGAAGMGASAGAAGAAARESAGAAGASDDAVDPVAAAQAYSQRAKALGLRQNACHLCDVKFRTGDALNEHLATADDAAHVEHRKRMAANADVSKFASIQHRAAMARKGGERKTGIGARVVFTATGDAIEVVGRLSAPDNAWQLPGGRICKFKTEGQRWRWECNV